MPASDDEIKYWLLRVSLSFGKKMPETQQSEWLEEMRKWRLDPPQWDQLLRAVKLQCEKLPSLAEIYRISQDALKSRQQLDRNWRTWLDAKGQWWAKILPGFRSVIPSDADVERWKLEAVQGQDEWRKWFEVGWARSGVDHSPAEMFASVARKTLASRAERERRSTELKLITSPEGSNDQCSAPQG